MYGEDLLFYRQLRMFMDMLIGSPREKCAVLGRHPFADPDCRRSVSNGWGKLTRILNAVTIQHVHNLSGTFYMLVKLYAKSCERNDS